MGVRNCADIGENLYKIFERLTSNQDLLKLLYYTDKNPLSQPDLTQQDIQNKVFEKLIKIVPRVGPKETANSLLAIRIASGAISDNDEFKVLTLYIEIFVPLTQWIIKDINLRPFKIMGEIQKSLKGKRVNGLGQIDGGNFELNFLTEEISCYQMAFTITSYD